ncbi:DUF2982 domain-containing protein [Vibrio cincinnatiensis]|jgi:hypothetical protein|uniref:DUF2982 domain-containing protein n=1 Tax=Vibrio cincinnatiensis DSM 19608 TaxID=1123491 RepID=A0A1T4LYZ6_VIBCI|nr:DUF2982 domain-containing protein [Vibrio cincinnatiensis]MCG3722129.1 DUF2982 domain-containing protein [Vibrio cincinnatiensis]MCG3733254.1 DUF2982 domain-containing protein [Vibrio cincinnatiensis]MCG3735444.1 DUF2982 domain-containing protein [Vibrio cincinnatiensis]MCG3740156.1 DUF2982 domain-containing protein [Vibrio cincinnatiensis]MCG3743732.1 DUF2982 domain-containing protein [Vibrio cincinnatiensis]
MPTLQLSNHPFYSVTEIKRRLGLPFIILIALIILFTDWPFNALLCSFLLLIAGVGYGVLCKSWVGFTLTATHFQQHFYYGGWVVKWNNIRDIGVCSYQQEGWHQPLPWIGIQLKSYSPFLEAICPRVAREMLLSQRALLYLGAKQQEKTIMFEDIVLDSTPYKDEKGHLYTGLMAMLANRMCYQREYYGFDIYIAEADLDRNANEFVGLVRRYLAAAEPER